MILLLLLACHQAPNHTGDTASNAEPLVVVTLNTHSFQEGADSLDKLEAIGQGLASLPVPMGWEGTEDRLVADLVGLNEVMSGTFWSYDYGGATHDGGAILQQALEAASGMTWYRADFGFAHWDSGELMSNVVLSRTPLLDTESLSLTTTDFWPAPNEQRSVGRVETDVPGLGRIRFYVTHTWGWDSVDTLTQVGEVKSFMALHQGEPAVDLLVGDLNVPSTSLAYQEWTEGPPFPLLDSYGLANPDGFTDPTTTDGTDRIDYILVGEGGPIPEDPACFRSARIFDGSSLPVVSDHYGVVTVLDGGCAGG